MSGKFWSDFIVMYGNGNDPAVVSGTWLLCLFVRVSSSEGRVWIDFIAHWSADLLLCGP